MKKEATKICEYEKHVEDYFKQVFKSGDKITCTFDLLCDLLLSYQQKNVAAVLPEPKKYPIGGYAPGNYMCICSTCKKDFMGDKMAVQCEHCAIKMTGGLNHRNNKP